jgi:hypothetical protein
MNRAEHKKLMEDRRKGSAFWQFVHVVGSLKLAVVLLITIGLWCATATFIESSFTSAVAQFYIYKSPWFMLWLVVLCWNLLCAALSRWPWQKRHVGFVVTHAGIISLLTGAMVGQRQGFEASVQLFKGEEAVTRLVTRETVLYFETEHSRTMFPFPVEVQKPTEQKPRVIGIADTTLRLAVDRYADSVAEENTLTASTQASDPAGMVLEFSSRMLGQSLQVPLATGATHDFFGMAKVLWEEKFSAPASIKGLALRVHWKEGEPVRFQLLRGGAVQAEGTAQAGDEIATGWNDWQVRFTQVFPHAQAVSRVVDKAGGDGAPGLRVSLLESDGTRNPPTWLMSGKAVRLFSRKEFVSVGFGLKLQSIPFSVRLLDFEVPRYEGTDKPADYISTVEFANLETGATQRGQAHMNYPAAYPGGFWRSALGLNYKFSQASWNPQNLNETTLQVLFDPGWPLKWLGSLLISAGIAIMFYWTPTSGQAKRRNAAGGGAAQENESENHELVKT